MGIIVDVGSVGNLAGARWLAKMASISKRHSRIPNSSKREIPLQVSGVDGTGNPCVYDAQIPICVPTQPDGIIEGTFKTPAVPGSDLPALIGLASLRNMKSIIDTRTNRMYLIGPGDFDRSQHVPPGTKMIQLKQAESGHLLMECDHFKAADVQNSLGGVDLKPMSFPSAAKPVVVETQQASKTAQDLAQALAQDFAGTWLTSPRKRKQLNK